MGKSASGGRGGRRERLLEQADPSANHADFEGWGSLWKWSGLWWRVGGGSPLRQGCLVPSPLAGPVRCEVGRGIQARTEPAGGPEASARPTGRKRRSRIPFIPREFRELSWGLRKRPEAGRLERMGQKERRQMTALISWALALHQELAVVSTENVLKVPSALPASDRCSTGPILFIG